MFKELIVLADELDNCDEKEAADFLDKLIKIAAVRKLLFNRPIKRKKGPHVTLNSGIFRGFELLPDGAHDKFIDTYPRRYEQVNGQTYKCPRCSNITPQWITDAEIWKRLPLSWINNYSSDGSLFYGEGGGTLCVPCFIDLTKNQHLWKIIDPKQSGLKKNLVVNEERYEGLIEEYGNGAFTVEKIK